MTRRSGTVARTAIEQRSHGRHPGSALPGARSRALVVGGHAAGARAHEARPPPASVPRQVHPAARRDAARPARPGGRAGARPVRGLGHDARAGARVRLRRDRRRHRRASTRCSCASRRGPTTSTRCGATSSGRTPRQRRSSRGAAIPSEASAVRARLVRAGGGGGAAPLPLARRAGRLGRRAPGRARALGPLGPPHGPLRPRVPARAAARALLVLQAPARVQAGRERRDDSSCATRSTRSTGSRRSRR